MKQGINFEMPVNIGIDMDLVDEVEIIMVQPGVATRTVKYPSDEASLDDDDNIVITWTKEQTYAFWPHTEILMDTRIKLNGTSSQPETKMISFELDPTLFRSSDLSEDESDQG